MMQDQIKTAQITFHLVEKLYEEDLGKILLLLYNAVSVHMNIKIQLNLMLGSEQFKVI